MRLLCVRLSSRSGCGGSDGGDGVVGVIGGGGGGGVEDVSCQQNRTF